MRYQSTKTYDHNLGFSCAFRQWRATHSHCRFLHGYALSFKFTFEATERDGRGWVVDFGGLDELKRQLSYYFDHTTLVSRDDPMGGVFQTLNEQGLIQLRQLGAVGCEAFAAMAYDMAADVVKSRPNVRVVSAEVREHGANSAIFYGDRQ